MAGAFKFDEPGSRVLREWNEKRAIERAIQARAKAGMRREWWDGVVGVGNGAGFAGGGVDRLSASLAQWSGGINADLDNALPIMRARARQLAQNTEFGRRFLSLVGTNVIGPSGPTLQVRAMKDSGQGLDKIANDLIEINWAEWSARADVRGVMDFAQMQRVAVMGAARDGDALLRIVRQRSLPNGIALQLLEADRLDETLNGQLSNGNAVRQGVEINSFAQPVAYHIKTWHPGERYESRPAKVERVPAEEMIHCFLPMRAEQVRGYTWFHAVLLRMQMLHAYEEAAVIAARVGAAKMGVFKRSEEASGDLTQLSSGTDAKGIPQMSAAPGEFLELPMGYELQSWNPEYPHGNFESFLKACFRGVATGLDVAAHNLTGDMTDVNYSSARIAELSEREQWEVLQSWWLRTVTMRVYSAWLDSALLRGDITFPIGGKALPWEKLTKFARASRFQGRRWHWVDPAKEIEAAERAVALGLASRTEIAASQGREFEDVVDELAQEKALLEAAGLGSDVKKPQSSPAAAEPSDDPGEEPTTPPKAGNGKGKKR